MRSKIISESGEALRKTRAKRYPNCLPPVKGAYSTRAEAILSVEQVCRSAKEHGGHTVSVEDRKETVS